VLRGAFLNHFEEFVRVAPEQQFGFFKFLNHKKLKTSSNPTKSVLNG
jgi:hypothetical protein